MTVMDRYILRHFLQVFVICFCSLTGLYIVIDAFGNLARFPAGGADHHDLGALSRVLRQHASSAESLVVRVCDR